MPDPDEIKVIRVQGLPGLGGVVANGQIAFGNDSRLSGDARLTFFGDDDPTLSVSGDVNVSGTLNISTVLTGLNVLQPSNEPSSPSDGAMYFDNNDKHFYGWNGTAWKQLDNA